MSNESPSVTVTWWNDVRDFIGPGVSREFETDLATKHFSFFAMMLGKMHKEPFEKAAERVEGDAVIAVATPKPENTYFESECIECGEVISKDEIHFEVDGESGMVYLCRHCFFSAPYEE